MCEITEQLRDQLWNDAFPVDGYPWLILFTTIFLPNSFSQKMAKTL